MPRRPVLALAVLLLGGGAMLAPALGRTPARQAPQAASEPAAPPTTSLAGLAAWVGCPPHCPAAARRLGLRLRSNFVLQFPPLHAALERLMGRRSLAEMLRMAEIGPPVERRDDWVRITLCRQEACATAFLELFAHLRGDVVVLCWHEERWEAQQLRWSANHGGVWRSDAEGRQPLPPEGCNNLGPLEGHDWDLLRRLADG